jgi:hypothetical protein
MGGDPGGLRGPGSPKDLRGPRQEEGPNGDKKYLIFHMEKMSK